LVWIFLFLSIISFCVDGLQSAQAGFCVSTIIILIFYYVGASNSTTYKFLCNLNVVEDTVTYVNKIRKAKPQISFYCACYHYETHTDVVPNYNTNYDVNGNAQTTITYHTHTHQEMVTTRTRNEPFAYSQCNDISGEILNEIMKYNVVKLHFFF